VTQRQQFASITLQFAGQLAGADALGQATHDQHQLRTGAPGAVNVRAGEAVKNPPALAALVVDQRRAVATMHAQTIDRPAPWAA